MPNYEITIEITKILEKGTCPTGHQVGDTFKYPEDRGRICPSAFHSIYPTIRVMQSGGSFSWFDEPNITSVCCPDYLNPVVFKISRKEIPE